MELYMILATLETSECIKRLFSAIVLAPGALNGKKMVLTACLYIYPWATNMSARINEKNENWEWSLYEMLSYTE